MIQLDLFSDKDKYLNIIKKQWLTANDTFPDFLISIPSETREYNEQSLQSVTVKFQKLLKDYSHIPLGRKRWRRKTRILIKDFLNNETIINLHKSMDSQTVDNFEDEVFEFLRHVRKFAPELTFADIGQATRNYIVYAMFKTIHSVNSGFSMAGFGYSMLYPFTDNYIDNKKCTDQDKQFYNQLIRDKIKGLEVHPTISHHKKTCELLQAIESVYPRDKDDSIFHLLLMMLDAQEKSIGQQNKAFPLTIEERLDISIYKGGISVLIDRFFVDKEITETDLIFYLGFGFFLQLADDLQDIKEDSQLGYSTIFTIDLNYGQEEKFVNKLLNFLHTIMNNYHVENDNFKDFVFSASILLILTSSIGSKDFFSQEYLDRLDEFLPIPSSTIKNYLHNQFDQINSKQQDKYLASLDELLKPS